MNEKRRSSILSALGRGILLGGSVGFIASWMGMPLQRAFFLGVIGGVLAGLTKGLVDKSKDK
ncbi:MAG: hypothetical protein EOM25_03030 [Deltaproteobacteria bacterium]|nr:hypothetical protein [Deltaproteobacteria bacterium]